MAETISKIEADKKKTTQNKQINSRPFHRSTWFRLFITFFLLNTGILIMTTVFSYIQVQDQFNYFIQRQDDELGFRLPGVWILEGDREQRHDKLIADFKENIAMATTGGFLIGIVISSLGATILSGTFTRPLRRLSYSIQDVIDRGFKKNEDLHTIENTSTNEINELVSKYNLLIIKLKETEQLRENLVSDVSHELKTPLTRLRGVVEGIQDRVYKADSDTLETIIGDIDHLEKMTERLQRVTQLKAGREKINLSEIELAKFIEDIRFGYTKDCVKLVVNIPDGLKIKADKALLKELFDNLLSNAFKYTDKGEILIRADEAGFSVKDSGVGISSNDLPLIFERFYRVDKSRASHTGGLGLGLPISREICELLGWKISVTSEVGVGSEFKVQTKS